MSRAWRSGSARAHGSIGAALLAVAVGLAHAATALAGPSGTLDPSFGGTGIVTVPVGHLDDFAFALALQPDGRIVAAGSSAASDDDFLALRLRADGTLDPSFAAGGVRTFDLAGGFERARAVALDGDGRIVLAGFSRVTSGEDFAVARLLADGTPDATFGTGGVVITSIGPFDDRAAGVVVQPDGRIIAAGYTKSTANRDVALVRYESDGRLDATFGAGGIAIAAIGSGNDEAAAVELDAAGRIVIGGYSALGGQYALAVARFDATGALDPSFGDGGSTRVRFSTGDAFGNALALDDEGRIVVAGRARIDGNFQIALARFDGGGALDAAFGDGGIVTTAFGTSSEGRAVALSPDGRIAVAGVARSGGQDVAALARYRVDGTLDPHFAGSVIAFPFGGTADRANAVAIQADGAIVVAGSIRHANDDDVAFARFVADDCGDGMIDPGEACDPSAPDSACCTETCEIAPAGTGCRAAADACDVADSCDGSTAACVDQRLPDEDGDGTCDAIDLCPATPDPDQLDADGDGTGDACDACTLGAPMDPAVLKIIALDAPAGEQVAKLTGRFAISGDAWNAVVQRGAHVVLEDAALGVVLDEVLPAGAWDAAAARGWSVKQQGTLLVFRDQHAASPVKWLRLRRAAATPDAVRFTLKTRRADFSTFDPLRATLALAAPIAGAGECGETDFASGCQRAADGASLVCGR
ncbi:MAG TPA: hypothetical protein VFD92_04090 [Candidatus Binatia bacterium]|nr:hypothetical protein [Candidatus Binatia bacterium]